MEEFLRNTFYDPANPAGYSSVKKLRQAAVDAGYADASWNKVREWLKKQEVYTLYKHNPSQQKRLKTPFISLNYQWEMDTFNMVRMSEGNDGYKHVLLCIDTFSKYLYAYPLKSLKSTEVAARVQELFDSGRKPTFAVRSDKGSEFKLHFSALLKKYGLKQFFAESEMKSGVVERAVKTVKSRLMKYLYEKQTERWVDVLPQLIEAYNHSIHSVTGMRPADVTEKNEHEILLRVGLKYPRVNCLKKRKVKPRFKVGDVVRITYQKTKFSREYDEKYTHELFKIKSVRVKENIPLYKLNDWRGDAIKGNFYQHELAKAAEPDSYKIEKVLKTKTVKGKKKYLVKFVGWSNKFNEWVDSVDKL